MGKLKTNEEVEQELYNKFQEKYTLLEDYEGRTKKIKVRHEKCKEEFFITPSDFLRKRSRGCNHCRIKNQTKDTKWFKGKVLDSCGKEFSVLGEYKTAKEKILMRHNKCNYEWETTPDNFLRRNSRCPYCSGNARTNTEEFKKRLKKLLGDEYSLLGEYTNARTNTLFKHNTCGYTWKVRPEIFTRGEAGCPNCKISSGENKVKKILNELNIIYDREVTFEQCKYKYVLPFDFVIYDKNNNVIGAIEYDGIQHFEPVVYFGGVESFELQVIKDNIKNTFCINNDIPLLRIPYTFNDSKIEKTIKEFYSKEVKQGTTNLKK